MDSISFYNFIYSTEKHSIQLFKTLEVTDVNNLFVIFLFSYNLVDYVNTISKITTLQLDLVLGQWTTEIVVGFKYQCFPAFHLVKQINFQ